MEELIELSIMFGKCFIDNDYFVDGDCFDDVIFQFTFVIYFC